MSSATARVLLAAAALLAVPSAAFAQSLWGVDGPSTKASNTAGPPGCSACPIAGPLVVTHDYTLPNGGSCALPVPFPGPSFGPGPDLGDITVNRVADTVWVTDGARITGYDKQWNTIADFPDPSPVILTGLGYQAPNVLWVTDGFFAMAVTPPAGCGGFATIVAGPFPVAFGTFLGLATDIDYDPCSNLLYLSYASGAVATQTTAGAPNGFFFPATGGCLLPFLSGIAVDGATPGTFFISDGLSVARVTAAGALAAPTTYAPCVCWPWAGAGITSGLAFDATPIGTCKGSGPAGFTPPVLAATHQAISPNPNFGLSVTGAPASTVGLLVVGPCLCPGLPLPCGAILCVSPSFLVLPVSTTSAGTAQFSVGIPGGFACLGIQLCAQFVFQIPGSTCPVTSNAIHLAIAAP